MLSLFKNLKIFYKLLIFNGIIALAMMMDLYISFNTLSSAIKNEKIEGLKNFTESAVSFMQGIHEEEEKGIISCEEAQKRIFQYIQSTRFNNGNYFWIQDMNNNVLLHPISKKLNNTNVANIHDKNGVYLFQEFTHIVKENKQGFVQYLWPKPGETEAVSKISYVKQFEPYQWIIGTGVYIDTISSEAFIVLKKHLITLSLIFIFLQIAIIFFNQSITKPFRKIEKILQEIIKGNTDVEIPPETKNEIGVIYKSIGRLRKLVYENTRFKTSLNFMETPIILSNENSNIIYHNNAFLKLFEKYKISHFQKTLNRSLGESLIGTNLVDINNLFQKTIVNVLYPFETEISLEGCQIEIKATPIMNDSEKKIGTIIQFMDQTTEFIIKNEVENTIKEISEGNFSVRIDTYKMEGFLKNIFSHFNDILNQIEMAINDISSSMKALSEGNLTRKISADYKGTLQLIKININNAIDELKNTMGKILESSQDLVSSSRNINTGSLELSERTEQQASNLEETAASMEELASTVRQTSEHANNANKLADQAKSLAINGGDIVRNAVTAMESIQESSNKITVIMTVMDEIAFQTNLLALNAAVEAARAGETGKGFAVVAEEVRSLAQRSSSASKQIKTFIEESSNNVKNGVLAVHNTGEKLNEIVTASKEVASLIGEIALASNEQTIGLEQINVAVSEMDQMTQANAAFVEKNTASTNSLNSEAQNLMELVNFFTFNEGKIKLNSFKNDFLDEMVEDDLFFNIDSTDFKFVDNDIKPPKEEIFIHEESIKIEQDNKYSLEETSSSKRKEKKLEKNDDWEDF